MGLTIRMILYALFSSLASKGIIVFDSVAGTVTFKIDDLSLLLVGIVGYGGTFLYSRWSKAKGGLT